MIFILRGHIRNSFENNELYDFVNDLYTLIPNLKIFIHTWNILANNISWRNITENNTTVTDELIKEYFGNLSHCIQHIMIDDDKHIKLIGNIDGTINHGPMPLIGWKNYWYGKNKIINYVYNNVKCDDQLIVNCRFDIFTLNRMNKTSAIHFITKHIQSKIYKNIFVYDKEYGGIDNIYIGNINTMNTLVSMFYYNLDNILSKHTDTVNQEYLVYRINAILFNNRFKLCYK